ncbi:MAG: PD40 domain-containing protein, partial [Acidobacteria bacterium]|nr:PD40 domain-containing protein [Acidobacteriota bacterium]
LEVNTPPTSDPASMAISPDGRRLVFAATADGRTRLWVRSLESTTAQPLVGTDGARVPFWSPDSRSVGFFADTRLKRIDVAGGPAQTLANAPIGTGGSWNRDGVIIFSNSGTQISRMSASGGDAVAVTRLDPPRQNGHRAPRFLPDGHHFVYFVRGTQGGVYLGALDAPEGHRLLEADANAVFTSPGYLLFVRQGTLFAHRFDPGRLVLAGDPVAVAERVTIDRRSAVAAVSASTSGIVAYRTGTGGGQRQLVWFDRSGKVLGAIGTPDGAGLSNPELSPDGTRVAVDRLVNGNRDVWLLETTRDVATRFTFDPGDDAYPVWAPDGRRLVFRSNRKGPNDLYQKLASGAGTEEVLLESPLGKLPEDWSPDGRFLLFRMTDPKT